jgi:hypothetical protein
MLSKSLMKHFKGFGSRFTELHAKLDADMFDFAIHRRQNETRSRKSTLVKTMRVYSMVSRGRLLQYTCRSVTLASPSSSFTKAVTTVTVRELSDTPRICSTVETVLWTI